MEYVQYELVNGRDWINYRVNDGQSISLEAALSRAIAQDHPCTDYAGCDIERARAEGFTYAAAHILMGATKTPTIATLLQLFPGAFDGLLRRGDGWPAGWEEWVTFHATYGIECSECGHYMYGNDEPDDRPLACSNCLAAMPSSEGEERESVG